MVGSNPIRRGPPPLNVSKLAGLLVISSSLRGAEAVHLPQGNSLSVEAANLLQLGAQLEAQAAASQGSEAALDSESKAQAQWGFLKNIVNIDTFFASGAHSSGSRAEVGGHRR